MRVAICMGAKKQIREIELEYSISKGEEPSAEIYDFKVWHPVLKKYMPGKRYEHLVSDNFLDSYEQDVLEYESDLECYIRKITAELTLNARESELNIRASK